MIQREVIDQEILNLEKKDTSYAVIERLAWLYIVKDHMESPNAITGKIAGSDFLIACAGKPIESILNVINDHMEAIQVLYPKEYEILITKIKNL